jgi:two-component system, OmpR family, phosphate regulon sensor histidine kinase PhoR
MRRGARDPASDDLLPGPRRQAQFWHTRASQSEAVTWEADLPPLAVQALRPLTRGRTYLNLLYLVLSLPLAVVYIVALLACAVVGAVLAPVGIGLLILVAGLVAARGFTLLERELAASLLGLELPPMVPLPAGSVWTRIRTHLRRTETWKSLAYLLLKLPLGLFVYTLAIAFLGPALNGVLSLLRSLVFERGFGVLLDLPGAAVGLIVVVAALHGANLLAGLWGRVVTAMLGPSEDQRMLWEAKRQAEAADRRRRELILNVSHELRTPIASIQGHLDSLLMPEHDRPVDVDPAQYLAVASAETRRLTALVTELLELARADASQLAMTIRPTDVVPIARSVTLTLAPLAAKERQITLVHPNCESGVMALVDGDRLTQILSNLVRNAINHTPTGGAVRVDAGVEDPQYVVLTVSDTGSGIAAADLPRIFDRFYRTDEARSRDVGGFGLGLSIARDLAEAMGGTITVASEVGFGSTFRVRLKKATD